MAEHERAGDQERRFARQRNALGALRVRLSDRQARWADPPMGVGHDPDDH